MPRNLCWRSPAGRDTIQKIIKKVVPAWKNGLRPVQEDFTSAILDGVDFLCCTATGDGKSAAFSAPILVLNEYNKNPAQYPAGFRTRANPVGIVVTPTKGLASNIVLELTRLNLSAFSYSREALAEARRQGISLADEIKTCAKWQVVCVDPEHLKSDEWREISEAPIFRSCILYAGADEVHLINEWGTDFRKDFNIIGLFCRGRFPSSISIFGLSATLAPGNDTTAVCESLGLFDDQFHMIRRTNERPNIHFVMQILSHGLAGYEFPDLLPFLRSGRKAVVHFHSLDMLFRCYVYIWRIQPASADKMRRVRMYHSLCSPAYNEETIRLIDEDPYCQIILATIAFSNGINAKSILDSISLGFSSTVDVLWQEKGRAGRQTGSTARGVVLVQKSTVKTAERYLNALSAPTPAKTKKGKTGHKQKNSDAMNILKARFLTETHCYIAFLNRHYQNPPLEMSTLDCIAAKRRLPCSLCLARSEQTLRFLAPPLTPAFPPLIAAPSIPKKRAPTTRKLKLTKSETDTVIKPLTKFRNSICAREHKRGQFMEHPQTMFLSSSIRTILIDNLLSISSLDHLRSLLPAWRHREEHSPALYQVVLTLQTQITKERELAAREAAAVRNRPAKRKAVELEDSSSEAESFTEGSSDSDSDSLPETIKIPPKSTRSQKPSDIPTRTVLKTVTNFKRPRRQPRAQATVAEATMEYGRKYKPRDRGGQNR